MAGLALRAVPFLLGATLVGTGFTAVPMQLVASSGDTRLPSAGTGPAPVKVSPLRTGGPARPAPPPVRRKGPKAVEPPAPGTAQVGLSAGFARAGTLPVSVAAPSAVANGAPAVPPAPRRTAAGPTGTGGYRPSKFPTYPHGRARPSPATTPAATTPAATTPAALTGPAVPTGPAVSKVLVTTLDPAVVNRGGGRYLGFRIVRDDGAATAGEVAVRLDYSSVASAFGGDFATRAQLFRYPACVLTTPQVPACRVSTPVVSQADPATGTLTAVVVADPAAPAATASPRAGTPASRGTARAALAAARPAGARDAAAQGAAASSSTGGVYVVGSGVAGIGGTYAATSVKASDGWVVGESSGSFTYSYPLPAAPSTGGGTPSLGLSYDSGSVDGLTSHENNQSSPVGLGWTLGVPFLEQRYTPCEDYDVGGLCWFDGAQTLSVGGHTSGLVARSSEEVTTGPDAGWRDVFAMQDDPGWRVERVFAGESNPNGDAGGVYWKVTSTDGTKYYFGREKSDWSGPDGPTNATYNVPVFSHGEDDPCNDADDQMCMMPWRWNLSYVVDPVGNLQVWRYQKDRYSYDADGHGVQHYDGAGYLASVSYGVTTANAPGTAHAPQRVALDYMYRCTYDGCGEPQADQGEDYPEVPFDLWCKGDADECPDGPSSPVFFYLRRLKAVTSTVWDGAKYAPVDRSDLDYGYPVNNDDQPWSAVMWLRTIVHTGFSPSGESKALPEVSFGGDYAQWLPNRLDESQAGTYQEKPRITDVTTELGGRLHVTYGQPNACDLDYVKDHVDTQTSDCFPSTEPNGHQAWFRRYLVTKLEVSDRYGAPTQTLAYEYDTGGGAAWHSENDLIAKPDEQSWSDYRGYRSVTIRGGTPGGPVVTTKKRFFRGMDGDHRADGSTPAVQVQTSDSADATTKNLTYPDSYYLRGLPLEERSIRADGSEASAVQYEYTAKVLDRGPGGPWHLHQHQQVQVRRSLTREMFTSGGVVRKVKHTTRQAYDPVYGLPVSTQDDGDPLAGTGATCVHTQYARNPGINLVDRMKTQVAATGACPADGSVPTTGITSRTDTYYDANFASLDAAPTAGLTTKIVEWASAQGTADRSTRVTARKYDDYGRVVAALEPDNYPPAGAATFEAAAGSDDARATLTEYIPATGAVTSVLTRTPVVPSLGRRMTATAVYDPARGRATSATDQNHRVTSLTFDPLGRLTAVRMPGDDYDAKTFTYQVSDEAPSVVSTLEYPSKGATPVRSWMVLDSLGRGFQTQSVSPSGGLVVSGTRFDDRGNPLVTVPAFPVTGILGGTPVADWYGATIADQVPRSTQAVFDDLNRPVEGRALGARRALLWTSTTSYDGLSVTVTPPSNTGAGAAQADLAPVTESSDLTGHVLRRTQAGATTSFGYDIGGNLVRMTLPSGQASGRSTTYGYDWLGRRTSSNDLDAGTSTTDYYPSGAVRHSRDAEGGDVFVDHDVLGRETATYAGTDAKGALLTSVTYDGKPIGATDPLLGTVTSKASYVGSTPAASGAGAGTPGSAYVDNFAYDTRYRTVRTDQVLPAAVGPSLQGTYTTSATYDGLDRQTSASYPGVGGLAPETVTTAFSGAYATSLTSPAATYVSQVAYTGIGQVSSMVLGASGATGSVRRTFDWDTSTGRLLGLGATTPSSGSGQTVVQNDTYLYSPTGDITKATDLVKGQQQCYTYDARDRLTAARTSTAGPAAGNACAADTTGPAPYDDRYTYDDDANLTALVHNGTRQAFGYGTNSAAGVTGGPHAPTTVTTTPAGATTGTTTAYGYDANGQLASKAVGGGAGTSYDWDVQGRLASVTSGAVRSTFTYGPDGDRWVRSTPSETVVYLDGQELHLAANGGAATVVRSYSFGGSTVAVRKTGDGAGLFWMLADQQGSASVAVNAADGTYTRDRYLPYGGNRDGGNFLLPIDRGWIGQVQDKETGLDYLNARYYDPGLAHFISTDPLNVTDNAASANPYTYGAANPITFIDPTGERSTPLQSGDTGFTVAPGQNWYSVSAYRGASFDDLRAWNGGSLWNLAPGDTVVALRKVVKPGSFEAGLVAGAGDGIKDLLDSINPVKIFEGLKSAVASAWDNPFQFLKDTVVSAVKGFGHAEELGGLIKAVLQRDAYHAGYYVGKLAIELGADLARMIGGGAAALSKVFTAIKDSKVVKKLVGGSTCSFSGETLVAMGDGAAKRIDEVKVGDQVLASEPDTGVVTIETVTDAYSDEHDDLVDLVVHTEVGDRTIGTTRSHPFYDATAKAWTDASLLVVGHRLRTVSGEAVRVVEVKPRPGLGYRYNLSVQNLHTYFVLAGRSAVLVHNACRWSPPTITVDRHGRLTNGKYFLDGEGMVKHVNGTPGKSQFSFYVNSGKAVLDAAAYADAHGLWQGSKAKVFVTNGIIGYTGLGTPTSWINVYRTSTGLVHGSPGGAP